MFYTDQTLIKHKNCIIISYSLTLYSINNTISSIAQQNRIKFDKFIQQEDLVWFRIYKTLQV